MIIHICIVYKFRWCYYSDWLNDKKKLDKLGDSNQVKGFKQPTEN